MLARTFQSDEADRMADDIQNLRLPLKWIRIMLAEWKDQSQVPINLRLAGNIDGVFLDKRQGQASVSVRQRRPYTITLAFAAAAGVSSIAAAVATSRLGANAERAHR